MNTDLINLSPILILLGTIGLILILALSKRQPARVFPSIAVFGLLAAIGCALRLIEPGATPNSIFTPAAGLGNSYLFDLMSIGATILLSLFLLGVIAVSWSLWSKSSWEWPIFLCALLGSLVGMILLSSSRHLIFFAIAFELASMPSYVLVGFRRFNLRAAEGSAKYVIFGAACSAIMLYGISLLYGLTGSFDLPTIATQLTVHWPGTAAIVALACILVGVAFKISLVPMHFWCPDAFEAAGADVAGWLSVSSKFAAIIALARFARFLIPAGSLELSQGAIITLSGLAVLTMTLANLSAYWQKSAKRMLAYSSIAHAGYMLCGVSVIADASGMGAVLGYVIAYMLMNLGAFAVVGLVEKQTGSDAIGAFTGLGRRNPLLGIAMVIFLFSLVGLPPLAGFAVKWILLSVLWQHGQYVLVGAILLNTLLSLFYYARIARAMYFEDVPSDELQVGSVKNDELPANHFSPTRDEGERVGKNCNDTIFPDPTQSAIHNPKLVVPFPAAAVLALCAAGLFLLFVAWGSLGAFGQELAAAVFR